MRGNHSAGEEEQRKKGMVGVERRRGEEETVIISSLSCESQPILQALPGKLEMHTNCFYSESVLPDSTTITERRPFFPVIKIYKNKSCNHNHLNSFTKSFSGLISVSRHFVEVNPNFFFYKDGYLNLQ